MSSLIVLLLVILLILAIYLYVKDTSKNYYFKCPNCKKDFQIPSKDLLTTAHFGEEYNVKCPYCQKKNYIRKYKSK